MPETTSQPKKPLPKSSKRGWGWSDLAGIVMAVVESVVWLSLAVFVVVAGWRILFGSDISRTSMLDTLERLEGSWHVLAVMVSVPLFYRAVLAFLQRVDGNWFPWGKKAGVGKDTGPGEANRTESTD